MKALQIRNDIFGLLNAIFVVLVAVIFTGMGRLWGPELPSLVVIIFLTVALLTLAAALVVFTIKAKEAGMQKTFFILTGVSAMCIPICAVLHNLVYDLCIKLGWAYRGEGGDEAVFFVLATLVCPILFVIGSSGSVALLISARLKKKESWRLDLAGI